MPLAHEAFLKEHQRPLEGTRPMGRGRASPPAGHSPICMQISPMAQVALLQTEMNSGFRLVPKMGMNSAGGEKEEC